MKIDSRPVDISQAWQARKDEKCPVHYYKNINIQCLGKRKTNLVGNLIESFIFIFISLSFY